MKVELNISALHGNIALQCAYATVASHACYLATTPGSAGIAECDAYGVKAQSSEGNRIEIDIRGDGRVYLKINASRGSLVSHNVVGNVIRAMGGLAYLSKIAQYPEPCTYESRDSKTRPWYDTPQEAKDWANPREVPAAA